MYLADAEVSQAVTSELVEGKNLHVRKLGIGVVIESLAIEMHRGLIFTTDIHIQTY